MGGDYLQFVFLHYHEDLAVVYGLSTLWMRLPSLSKGQPTCVSLSFVSPDYLFLKTISPLF